MVTKFNPELRLLSLNFSCSFWVWVEFLLVYCFFPSVQKQAGRQNGYAKYSIDINRCVNVCIHVMNWGEFFCVEQHKLHSKCSLRMKISLLSHLKDSGSHSFKAANFSHTVSDGLTHLYTSDCLCKTVWHPNSIKSVWWQLKPAFQNWSIDQYLPTDTW